MKKIFVSYANSAMAYSLKMIGKQARRLGLFDEIKLMTPSDLPQDVLKMPQMKAARGGGYMIWKPVIISQVLEGLAQEDIVVFCDAGCTLRKSSFWSMCFRLLQRYQTICFQYDISQPQWEKWGATDSLMRHWTKKSTLDYCSSFFEAGDLGSMPQVLSGIIFFTGAEQNKVISRWKALALSKPELFADPDGEELRYQHLEYVSHRHDQSIFTSIVLDEVSVLVLPEISEKFSSDAFVYASRIRARSAAEYYSRKTKEWFRRILGQSRYDRMKKLF